MKTRILFMLIPLVIYGCSPYMKFDGDKNNYCYYKQMNYTFIVSKNDIINLIKKDDAWFENPTEQKDILIQEIRGIKDLVIKELLPNDRAKSTFEYINGGNQISF